MLPQSWFKEQIALGEAMWDYKVGSDRIRNRTHCRCRAPLQPLKLSIFASESIKRQMFISDSVKLQYLTQKLGTKMSNDEISFLMNYHENEDRRYNMSPEQITNLVVTAKLAKIYKMC